jgi:hypothetical protein
MRLELGRLERLGLNVISRQLVTQLGRPQAAPRRLAEALPSLTDACGDATNVAAP